MTFYNALNDQGKKNVELCFITFGYDNFNFNATLD